MSPSPHAESLVGRARRASERFRAHSRVLALISPLIPHTVEHEEMTALARSLEAGFNALVLLDGRAMARISLRHRPGMGVRFELLPAQQMLLQRAMVLREPISIPADATR